jgi:hypothetical protein
VLNDRLGRERVSQNGHVTAPEGAALRREIERWFVRRGVPQFIDGYGTEQSMDRRATPLIYGWLVAWAALFWFSRPDVPLPWSALAVIGTMVFFTFMDGLTDALRGRSLRRLPRKYDLVDIAQFAVLPVLPTLLVERNPIAVAFSVLNLLLGIGVIYIVIGFGLLDIAVWAIDRLRDQLVHIATLVSRTLPLLLILVVFLMFSAEIWEAAHAMHAGELGAVSALLLAVGSVLILTTFRPEVQRLEAAHEWPEIRDDAAGTPVARLADRQVPDGFRVPALRWLERRNVEFVVLVNQLLQSTFVALLVFTFLVVFGLIVVPSAVQAAWIGAPVTVLVELDLLGETRALSSELVTVSALLSGIVGLYFTGLSLTDATYRAEHFTAVVGEIRMLLAARALYRAHLARSARAGAKAAAAPPVQGR